MSVNCMNVNHVKIKNGRARGMEGIGKHDAEFRSFTIGFFPDHLCQGPGHVHFDLISI